MKYKVEFSRAAAKQLSNIPSVDLKKLARRIDQLSENPIPAGHEKMKGQENLYRVRQGDYRVLYSIMNQTLIILIVKIGHRREVYR